MVGDQGRQSKGAWPTRDPGTRFRWRLDKKKRERNTKIVWVFSGTVEVIYSTASGVGVGAILIGSGRRNPPANPRRDWPGIGPALQLRLQSRRPPSREPPADARRANQRRPSRRRPTAKTPPPPTTTTTTTTTAAATTSAKRSKASACPAATRFHFFCFASLHSHLLYWRFTDFDCVVSRSTGFYRVLPSSIVFTDFLGFLFTFT